MSEDKVTNTHPDYDKLQPFRDIFADVCKGTSALREGGTKYLPKFPKEEQKSWDYRNGTSSFLNVTQKTVETMCGLVFQKDITLNDDVPAEIVNLWENIDNKGTHGNVFSRDAFEKRFAGCSGILVDAPAVKANNLEDERTLGLRPYWILYQAKDITNWDYEINPVSKKLELSLVVLRECVTQKSGQFIREEKVQYRVLLLDDARKPVWQLWTEKAGGDPKVKEYELTANGTFEKQSGIPFGVVGKLGEMPPLMDLSYKNIEHYQTYSDYKSGIHKTNRPLFYSINLDGEPDALGSDIWFKCNEGGSIGFVEPAGNSFDSTESCLENMKKEMSMLGLAMITSDRKQNAEVTATEFAINSIQETSALQVMATQLKDTIELALGFTAQYLGQGQDKGGTINLGATWTQMFISPLELQTLSGLVDLGQMSLRSFVEIRVQAGQLPDDVDAEEELSRIKDEEEEAAKIDPVLNAQGMPNGQQNPQGTPPPTIG